MEYAIAQEGLRWGRLIGMYSGEIRNTRGRSKKAPRGRTPQMHSKHSTPVVSNLEYVPCTILRQLFGLFRYVSHRHSSMSPDFSKKHNAHTIRPQHTVPGGGGGMAAWAPPPDPLTPPH